jgi:hypothetical protein
MRKRSALGIALLVTFLLLATAAPAHAAARLRLYRGETSQGERIRFIVARTDVGRFVREMDTGATFTCEDQTTEGIGFGIGFGRASVPITEKAFSFDEVLGNTAYHLAGELGSLQGQGTLSVVEASLTEDEQAQLCTTGDLTWTVEFIRRL